MLAIGNDEIDQAEPLGDFILCHNCGERHQLHYGEEILEDETKVPSKLLSFYECGDKAYLADIKGKDIRKR